MSAARGPRSRDGDGAGARRSSRTGVHDAELLAALEDLSTGVYFFDRSMHVRWLNREALRRLGCESLDAILGRSWYDIHPDMKARREVYERVLAGESIELRNARASLADGPRYYDVRYQPLRDGRGLVAFSIDVTDRYLAEERLKVANRLESLGRLASGIAHDLNNHLTAVFGYTELCRHELGPKHACDSHLERIIEVSRGSQALIEKLLDFARQRTMKTAPQALGPLIDDIARRLLEPLMSEEVQVVLDLDPNAGSAAVDAAAIEQIFVNLMVNARDAMPAGGVLQVRAASRHIPPAEAERRYPELEPGEYLVLEVTDNGSGMDEATRARCFEPFFTTKTGGDNSGLGLSTCFGMVRQMGGLIELESKPGQGTTFSVLLPKVDPGDEPRPASRAASDDEALRGSETVLLAEDRKDVRVAVASMLRRYGYLVLEASNGGEALLIAEEVAVPIHLLLTDVIMPRVNGPALARRIQALRPEIRVLYMSGNIMHPSLESEIDAGALPLLQKPFTGEAVARALREVLDAEPEVRTAGSPTDLRRPLAPND